MTGYAGLAYGTPVTGFNPSSLTPAIPGSPPVGSLLILQTGVQMGNTSSPTITGWTNLSTVGGESSQETTQALYGRISTGSGDAPTVAWGYAAWQYAFINTYSGNPATLSGIISDTPSVNYQGVLVAGVAYAAAAVSNPGCLVIAFGCKNTALSSAPTWNAFGSFTKQNSAFVSTVLSAVYNEWIQTTATSISAGNQLYSSSGDSSGQNNCGRIVALLPAGATNTTITPSVGSLSLAGNSPNIAATFGTIIVPNTA